VLNAVWDVLLPAMTPDRLAEDPAGCERLAQRLSGLAAAMPSGTSSSPLTVQVGGQRYQIEENPLGVQWLTFFFEDGGCVLEIEHAQGAERIPYGYAEWRAGTTHLDRHGVQKTSSAARWAAENRLVLLQRLVETPFFHTLTCDFTGDRLGIAIETNVSFGEKTGPPLVGQAG
jgi:hypothetical protein